MSLDVSIDPPLPETESRETNEFGSLSNSESTGRSAPSGRSTISKWMRRAIRFALRILAWPVRTYLSLRRSMTVASVAALLTTFMTLNVIWGFPWSGMMGACFALLVVGFIMNRIMMPKLKLSVSLPRSAIAGHPFSLNVRLSNRRMLPAMNLRVGWHREGVREIKWRRNSVRWDASPPVSVSLLRGDAQMQWHGSMRFDQRGIHQLPPFQVASTFPFFLFHNRHEIDTETTIAVTPAPFLGDDDPMTRVLMAAIGDWAAQLVAGAPVEYIGNREYQVGVPVRRWDFASWARLGRPIVREYQSPSIQSVALVIDTSLLQPDPSQKSRSELKHIQAESEARFERLMSISASAIADITSRRVQLKLFLTSESDSDRLEGPTGSRPAEGNELMLVRLAAAQPVAPDLGSERLRNAIESSGSQPVLVFSLYDLDHVLRKSLASNLAPNVTYLPVESPNPAGERRHA